MVAQTELNKNVELEIARAGKPLKVTTQIKEEPVDYQSTGVLPEGANRSRKSRGSRTIENKSPILSRQLTWRS